MAALLFYLFAGVTVIAAAGVVLNRNAVNAAMSLLVSFVGMAALFVLLDAYFLALLQVLVYAGAVVVLFLFIIMLFDVQGGDPHRRGRRLAVPAGVVALALLVIGVVSLIEHSHLSGVIPPPGPAPGASLKNFGYALFTTYLLPMEVTGFLLLIAMLGVTVLGRRRDPGEGSR